MVNFTTFTQALRESEEEARQREEAHADEVDIVESIGVDPLDERWKQAL